MFYFNKFCSEKEKILMEYILLRFKNNENYIKRDNYVKKSEFGWRYVKHFEGKYENLVEAGENIMLKNNSITIKSIQFYIYSLLYERGYNTLGNLILPENFDNVAKNILKELLKEFDENNLEIFFDLNFKMNIDKIILKHIDDSSNEIKNFSQNRCRCRVILGKRIDCGENNPNLIKFEEEESYYINSVIK